MRRLAVLLSGLAIAVAPAAAAVLVVLDDGEVVRGLAAKREGSRIAITVSPGERILVRAARVVEVRTLDDGALTGEKEGDDADRTGIVPSRPRQLAGKEAPPPTPREQTAVLGEPARFPPGPGLARPWPRSDWPDEGIAGNNFSPSEWAKAPRDPEWSPADGFPSARLLGPSRARWPRAPIAPEWDPADGWRAHRATFGTSTLPEGFLPRAGLAREIDACARHIVASDAPRSEGVRVGALEGRGWEALPFRLYEVERRSGDIVRRTIFAVEGSQCRAIAGDLPVTSAAELASQRTIRGYNRVLLATPRPLPPAEPVAQAIAVTTLTDTDVMGARRERLVPLGAPADLDRIAAHEPVACELSRPARRRIHALAREAVAPPIVATGEDRIIAFWSWSPQGGVLSRHVVRIAASGAVSLETEETARHLGDHRDEPVERPLQARLGPPPAP